MSGSGFASIDWSRGGVSWACTDAALFEWVLTELTKICPGCRLEKFPQKETFVAPFTSTIDELGDNDNDYYVTWWILKQLCEKGWEPFHMEGVMGYGGSGHFYLRRVSRPE